MTSIGKAVAMTLWAISVICLLFTAFVHIMSRRNKLIILMCISGSFIGLAGLSGLVYGHETELKKAKLSKFTHVPSYACIIQALVVEYAANITLMGAVCFANQTYRLLVKLRSHNIQDERTMKIYYIIIFGYATIMMIPLTVLSIKYNAIQPRGSGCDVTNPSWIRLLGYAGSTLMLLIPGIYFSSCAILKVLQHAGPILAAGKLTGPSNPRVNPPWDEPRDIESRTSPSQKVQTIPIEKLVASPGPFIPQNQADLPTVTLVAAIRMIVFTVMFVLICLISSIQTMIVVFHDKKLIEDQIGGQDFSGGITGIAIFLLFGVNSQSKKYLLNIKRWFSGCGDPSPP